MLKKSFSPANHFVYDQRGSHPSSLQQKEAVEANHNT
jgi:hypothetical protein